MTSPNFPTCPSSSRWPLDADYRRPNESDPCPWSIRWPLGGFGVKTYDCSGVRGHTGDHFHQPLPGWPVSVEWT